MPATGRITNLVSIDGLRLDAVINRPAAAERGSVLLVHGITANLDEGGMYGRLAEGLAAGGYGVLRFLVQGSRLECRHAARRDNRGRAAGHPGCDIARAAAQTRGCDFHTVLGSDHGFDTEAREDEAIEVTLAWLKSAAAES